MTCFFKHTYCCTNLPFINRYSLPQSPKHTKNYCNLAFLPESRHPGKAQCCYLQHSCKKHFYHKSPPSCPVKSSERAKPVELQEQLKREKKAEFAEEDYVGPACLRSNLRPVWYSTRFSSHLFVDQRVRKKNLQHPYSLQEFRSDLVQPPQPLSALRAQLELEDLEWRFLRNRVDKFNQSFWESQSTHFEECEAAVKLRVLQSKDVPPIFAQNTQLQEQLDYSLDEFYRSWLIQQKEVFMKYNWEWWRLQPALMKGGWKAQMRSLKWKLACWKYAFSFENLKKRLH